MIDTIEELSESICGKKIESVELNEDGLHLTIDDGSILVIAGGVCIGLIEPNVTLQ